MNFKTSGLPNDAIVKKAFDISWAGCQQRIDEDIRATNKAIDDELAKVSVDTDPRIPANQKESAKAQLKKNGDIGKAQTAVQIKEQHGKFFMDKIVGPAKLMATTSENPSPELIAAILVTDVVRSPLDYERIVQEFGPAVSGVVAEYIDIVVYQSELETKLANAGSDAKRIKLATLVSELNEAISLRVAPGHKPQLIGGVDSARQWIKIAEITRGTDKKLDTAFVKAFNGANTFFKLGMKVAVSNDNKLIVTEIAQPKKHIPAAGNKPSTGSYDPFAPANADDPFSSEIEIKKVSNDKKPKPPGGNKPVF